MSAPNPTDAELEARETELFRSGPLSVLTASVKSNSQVRFLMQREQRRRRRRLFVFQSSLRARAHTATPISHQKTGPDQPSQQPQAPGARQGEKRRVEESEIEEKKKKKREKRSKNRRSPFLLRLITSTSTSTSTPLSNPKK